MDWSGRSGLGSAWGEKICTDGREGGGQFYGGKFVDCVRVRWKGNLVLSFRFSAEEEEEGVRGWKRI